MAKSLVNRAAWRLVLAAAFVMAVAGSASADFITLTDVSVNLDFNSLVATVSAGLEAHSDTAGGSISLDALSVSASQDGSPLDAASIDDLPFFLNAPLTMQDGDAIAPIELFRLTGLTPGSSYTGSFFLQEGDTPLESPPQVFAFDVPATAPVPEPGTLMLLAIGVAALVARGRQRLPGRTS